jgi:hypothetical protein
MTIPFEEIKAESLADPEVKREYDALASEFEALVEIYRRETGSRYQAALFTPHPQDSLEPCAQALKQYSPAHRARIARCARAADR